MVRAPHGPYGPMGPKTGHGSPRSEILATPLILPRCVSKPVLIQSGTNVNGEVYREMCLRGGLPPFIDEKDPEGGYLFCPDPALAHYARDTV